MNEPGVALSTQAISPQPTRGRQTQKLGSPVDFQDLCSCAMDQAFGIERASFSTVAQLNSSVLDFYRNSLWLAPAFSDLLGQAARAFALGMDLHASWLHLMLPYATLAPEAMSNFATPGNASESSVENGAQRAAEDQALAIERGLAAKVLAMFQQGLGGEMSVSILQSRTWRD